MYLEKWRVVFLGLLLLIALPLLGAGCKKQEANVPPQDSGEPVVDANPPVTDSGLVIPEGWQVYRNTQWGMSIAYPAGWYAKGETLTNPTPADLVRVVFDVQPIPEGEREIEPVFMVMLEAGSGTLEQRIARYAPLLTRSTLQLGQRVVTRFTYEDDFIGGTPVVYVFEEDGRVYLLLRADGNDTYLETMIQTLEIL